MQRVVAGVLVLCACGGGSREPGGVPAPALPADAAPAPDAAVAPPDAGPALTEAEARALIAARFRAAGLRVRQDVPVAGVTLDGADPQRRVGYEYVAEGDVTAAFDESSASEADAWAILVIEAADAAQVGARVDAFLSALPSTASDP